MSDVDVPATRISPVVFDLDRKLPYLIRVDWPVGGRVVGAYATRQSSKLQALDGSKLGGDQSRLVLVVEHEEDADAVESPFVVMRDGTTFPLEQNGNALEMLACVGHPTQGFPVVLYVAVPLPPEDAAS